MGGSSDSACINVSLPDELISYMFNFLDVKTRLTHLPLVCRKWRDVVNFGDVKECHIFDLHDELCMLDFDCPLRKSFDSNTSRIDGDNPLQDVWLCKFTKKCLTKLGRNLKLISFQTKGYQVVSLRSTLVIRIELIEILLTYCPKITELNFLRCRLTDESASMLDLFQNIRCLKLNSQQLLDRIWPSLCPKLDAFESRDTVGHSFYEIDRTSHQLRNLNLHTDLKLESNSRPLAVDSLVDCYPNLTELRIETVKLGGSILSFISELKLLIHLGIMITETTSPSVVDSICRGCTQLKDLTIIDRYSNGAINFDIILETCGKLLESFAFNSTFIISADQLRAIKQFRTLKRLILRTNKLPALENATEKAECYSLNELVISSSNRDEKSQQYGIFLASSSECFTKLGYLPRGWSLHATDGLEPKMVAQYLSSYTSSNSDDFRAKQLTKLLLYADDSEALKQLFGNYIFTNLTGMVVFGKCELEDETCSLIASNCPRLSYLLTENALSISPAGVSKLLNGPNLQELHVKYRDLEANERFCFAMGKHPKLKYVAFRGMLMPNKMRLRSEHWDKIMLGRLELFNAGLTCERLFIDCFYEKRNWPRKLACALRKLWISCRGMRSVEQEDLNASDGSNIRFT